jgi:hypothetical protein
VGRLVAPLRTSEAVPVLRAFAAPRAAAVVWGLALVIALLPLALLDRYRRADLSTPRDGPWVLAVCRESLRAAGRLDRGLEVRLDPEDRRFEWGVSDPGELSRMRWFLRDGFGERPHYGTGTVVTTQPRATLLLPVLTPRQLELRLRWSSATDTQVTVKVNGHPLESLAVSAEPSEANMLIPARLLFRGDNEITLEVRGLGGVRLLQIAVQA